MYGINYIGLKRQGFTNEQLAVLKRAYDLLFRSGHRLAEAVKLVRKEFASHKHIMEMADFVNSTRRGLCASVGRDEETDE
jgi:UDP-N-acetylglucosamine acyltransferase